MRIRNHEHSNKASQFGNMKNILFLLFRFLRSRCAGAGNRGVATSLVGLFALVTQVLAASSARRVIEHRLIGCTWFGNVCRVLLDLFILRHTNEPVQEDGGAYVENDVDPKDTAIMRSVVFYEYDNK